MGKCSREELATWKPSHKTITTLASLSPERFEDREDRESLRKSKVFSFISVHYSVVKSK
jgi:hypothetical protein